MATAPKNWIDFVGKLSFGPFAGDRGGGFLGVLIGYVGDTVFEALSTAPKMAWLREPTSPDDVLPLVGDERRMPRYPVETSAQYRTRLLGAWETYKFPGTEGTMVAQLAAAGHPGVTIYDPSELVFLPSGYWSHFVVSIPEGSHAVTAVGPAYGSFKWGDGTVYGPLGLTREVHSTIKAVIAKWKPVQWICREVRFQLGGGVYAYLRY
jgi:hypothetical protein